ncbi:DUF86 domain-containing protein [Pasteuria penetrans]|uniref:DUF86 domain-containing protein n=1 Tax=Pasteuria penetrans TaxID=86005 RepID=UPI000FA853E2|nr:HepT-like ribonuclease domain-containing protein [Pasteuria penetrans]
MYRIDKQAVQDQLQMLHLCAEVLEHTSAPTFSRDLLSSFAVARASHIAMECIIDIGVRLIDALCLRDPGCYRDVIDILAEGGFLPEALAGQLVHQLGARRRLVQDYATLSVEAMWACHFPPLLCCEVAGVFTVLLERLGRGEYM